jgi:hypothetical protein
MSRTIKQKQKMVGIDVVPSGHRFVIITNRSPSGRWENDDVLIVTELDAIRLKMEHGQDFYDATDLANGT